MNDLKIFVVEDNVVYLNLLKKYLLSIGCEDVTGYENGENCLNDLHQKPNVIFLDYYMDSLNGSEVLNKIKRFDPNIFVVMISGQEEVQTAVDFLKNGGFDYLKKGEDDMKNVEEVLKKIVEVKELTEATKPGFFQRIFKRNR
jgi:DNA-binding NtrC family response regulator